MNLIKTTRHVSTKLKTEVEGDDKICYPGMCRYTDTGILPVRIRHLISSVKCKKKIDLSRFFVHGVSLYHLIVLTDDASARLA